MKTKKSIVVALFALLTAQIASAYYCPSTGRWLSRDPIGEPGFETLRAASVVSPVVGSVQSQSTRWINRDPVSESSFQTKPSKVDTTTAFLDALGIRSYFTRSSLKPNKDANQNTVNLYIFVGNSPISTIDNLGLFPPCFGLPLPSCSSVCDAYGNETYPGLGVNLQCFCKCAGDSPWSKSLF